VFEEIRAAHLTHGLKLVTGVWLLRHSAHRKQGERDFNGPTKSKKKAIHLPSEKTGKCWPFA
jgi:hypothetical protein